jgi:hypothetical protein
MSAVRLAAVLGSLVALAILLSPVSPLTFRPGTTSPAENVIDEEPVDEAKIAPTEVTPEDFAECNSVNDGIQTIVAGGGKNETYKIAADLLLGEYCNRPDLVHQISATSDPAVTLVAYACEAANGLEGDSALRDSLADHTAIYCESSGLALTSGLDSLTTAVEGFRLDFIPELEAANAEAGAEVYDIESITAELESVSSLAAGAKSLLDSGQHHDASRMLEQASISFNALLESLETE